MTFALAQSSALLCLSPSPKLLTSDTIVVALLACYDVRLGLVHTLT